MDVVEVVDSKIIDAIKTTRCHNKGDLMKTS